MTNPRSRHGATGTSRKSSVSNDLSRGHVGTLAVVGLRAAEPGLALLGLLRHRSRRLAGEPPRFLGRPPNSEGDRSDTERHDQERNQGQIEGPAGAGSGASMPRSLTGSTGTSTSTTGVSPGPGSGSRRRPRSRLGTTLRWPHWQQNRDATIGIGQGVDRCDRSNAVGHLKHCDHAMASERLITLVQIRRGRDLEIGRHRIEP